jgi:hypothetical protein
MNEILLIHYSLVSTKCLFNKIHQTAAGLQGPKSFGTGVVIGWLDDSDMVHKLEHFGTVGVVVTRLEWAKLTKVLH